MKYRAILVALFTAACSGGDGGGPAAPTSPVTPVSPVPPPPPSSVAEARALWVSRFEFDSPAKIAQIMTDAKAGGFNVIYFQVRGAGDAIYKSSLEPCAVVLCGKLGGTPSWDPLAVAVTEAHSRGLQLHAWMNALTALGSGAASTCATLVEPDAGNPRHMLLTNPEWRVRDQSTNAQSCPNSEEYVWVSPGILALRTHTARVAADIARRYAVDGIHLDRIRYPGTAWSYDAESLSDFGKSPAQNSAEWAEFRRSRVALMVKAIHDSARAARPAVIISAAVWGIFQDKWSWRSSEGFGQYLQDPRTWASGGYLDIAVPMTYFSITPALCGFADWQCLLTDHMQGYSASGRHAYIAIAANKGSAEVLKQITAGRAAGVKGFAVYSYSSASTAGLFSILGSGPFKEAVPVPAMSWR